MRSALRSAAVSLAVGMCLSAAPARAQGHLELKWVRDSEEYATLTRQVYRQAARAVEASARQVPRGRPWAVVLDVDETTLDNSVYQLERAAYGQPFEAASWTAWTMRGEAGVVPGVQEFIAAARRLGGRVAWISNRGVVSTDATRANLERFGLWGAADRLCLQSADTAYTKAVRRREVATGSGACAWAGEPVAVLVFLGDQLGDFPAAGEGDPDAGSDAAFGSRYFLLPDPLYGSWERRVTRRRP